MSYDYRTDINFGGAFCSVIVAKHKGCYSITPGELN